LFFSSFETHIFFKNYKKSQVQPLVIKENQSFMTTTPSVSKSGWAMRMADDLVAKLRRTEAYRLASVSATLKVSS
jgi:hypothetical protein